MCKAKIIGSEADTETADKIINTHDTDYNLISFDMHLPSMFVTFIASVGLFIIQLALFKIKTSTQSMRILTAQ